MSLQYKPASEPLRFYSKQDSWQATLSLGIRVSGFAESSGLEGLTEAPTHTTSTFNEHYLAQ